MIKFNFEQPTLLGYLPLIYPLLVSLRNICETFTLKTNVSVLVLTCNMILGKFIPGSIYYIKHFIHYLRKGKITRRLHKASLIKSNRSISVVFSKPDHKKRVILTYFIIFCSALFLILLNLVPNLLKEDTIGSNLVIFRISIFVLHPLFSYFILNIKLFRHHYLSIALTTIGFSMTLINVMKNTSTSNIITQIVLCFIQSLVEVGTKYIMDQKYIEPFRLLFFQGIFGLVIFGLMYITFVLLADNGIKNDFIDAQMALLSSALEEIFTNGWNVILFIGCILFSIGSNVGDIFTNYYYNPTSRLMSFHYSLVVLFVVFAYKIKVDIYFPFALIGYVVMVIGNLIFFEMVSLICCELNTNTQNEIVNRSEKDVMCITQELESLDVEYDED